MKLKTSVMFLIIEVCLCIAVVFTLHADFSRLCG